MSGQDAMRVVVIGASAAGLRAAARARRLMPGASITVLDAGEHISYAACGLPYFVSGDIPDAVALMDTTYGEVRDAAFFRDTKGVDVLTRTRAVRIDRQAAQVETERVDSGERGTVPYDRLVLATGAAPQGLPGVDLASDRLFTFKTLEDAKGLRERLQTGQIERVAVIGAGFIGCELAEAFAAMWGASVDLIEAADGVLPQLLDPEMALLVEAHLKEQGVTVHTGAPVQSIAETDDGLTIATPSGVVEAGHAIVCIGVKPCVDLARDAGLEIGSRGGVVVDEHLRTSDPAIFAAGDCIEVTHCVTGQPTIVPLGSLANRQGRAVGDNVAGGATRFGPVAGSACVKVFDVNVASAGLSESAASKAGLDTGVVWGTFPAIAHYYPEAPTIQLKLVYEPATGRLVGLQAVGQCEVVKRADVFGNLLKNGAVLTDLIDAEFAYAPPYAPAVDPLFTLGCAAADQETEGVRSLPPTVDLADHTVLDVRLPEEIEAKPAETAHRVAIPLGELRRRIGDVPRDRPVAVLCERGARSCEAARILMQAGFDDVRYVGGGRQLRQQNA